jgi:hypothetical protein
MNYTVSKCGHYVPACGAPNSQIRERQSRDFCPMCVDQLVTEQIALPPVVCPTREGNEEFAR